MAALDGERWRGGDIANLKPERLFSPDQYNALLAPGVGSTRGYLDAQACGHPVVIVLRLSKRSTHAMITPISSHGSGRTAFAMPWARRRNKHKDAEHFRAICDTPRPSTRREALRLEGGAVLPMPTASWIDIQKVWVVPLAVLRLLSTDGGPHWVPRMQRDSLIDLRAHMSEECGRWKEHMRRLQSVEPSPTAICVAISPGSASDVSISKGNWAAIVAAATAEPSLATGKEEQQQEQQQQATASPPPISTPTTSNISEDTGGEDTGSEDTGGKDTGSEDTGSEVKVTTGSADALLPPLSAPDSGAKGNNSNSQSDVDLDEATAPKLSWACALAAPALARTLNVRQRMVLRKRQATTAASSAYQQTSSVLPNHPLTEDPEVARLTTLQDAASSSPSLESTATIDSHPDYFFPSASAIPDPAISPGSTFVLRPTVQEFIPSSCSPGLKSVLRPTVSEFIPSSHPPGLTFVLRPTVSEFIPFSQVNHPHATHTSHTSL